MNARHYIYILILVIVLALLALVWGTNTDANRLNATAGIAVAAGTIVLALVTQFGIQASQSQARESQYASARPILVPTEIISLEKLWEESFRDIEIKNVGTGVALNVAGVLLPPPMQTAGVPPQLSTRSTRPIAANEPTKLRFDHGGTIFTGEDCIAGIYLGVPVSIAPEEGLPSPLRRKYRAEARLTLSYSDLFHRKHAVVYDFDTTGHWVAVAILEDIPEDLNDMDAKKT